MGKLVSVSFCREKSSICKKNSSKWPWIVEKFEVLSFLMQFPYKFKKILFEFPTESTQQRENDICITFFEENVAAFCFKNFRNPPKESKDFNIFVFVQLV